jgi:hypothetical protein
MDQHEEHQQHHQKEREHKKDERKLHEHEQERQVRTIHPAWFLIIGVALIAIVVVFWMSL